MPDTNLRGFTVAITADRRRDEQAVGLERLGLEVVMFPLLRTDAEDQAALRALTEGLVREPPGFFLANTGYGMRSWLQLASQWGLLEDLVAGLKARTAIAARGAKALGELRRVGLDAWYKAPGETLEEVVARLSEEELPGTSVVIQLHGEPPCATLDELRQAGARVTYMPVYRMGGASDRTAEDLVRVIIDGLADAVTFTAAPAVRELTRAARQAGLNGQVLEAFNSGRVVAACIGEVCAGAARLEGIAEPLVPEHARLGSLARHLADHLAERQVKRT